MVDTAITRRVEAAMVKYAGMVLDGSIQRHAEAAAEKVLAGHPAAPASPPARPFSEGQSTDLDDVEVFTAGRHHGYLYTSRDLHTMARNFNRYSSGPRPWLRVPAVLGHEETQEYLERSDLPAAAWGTKAYVGRGKNPDGNPVDVLKMNFTDVPVKVANLLRDKRYRTVSAEIYDDIPEGLPGAGTKTKMLRRIAFLGGDIPSCKDLAELPMPHSERARSTRVLFSIRASERGQCRPLRGAHVCFSEVRRMKTKFAANDADTDTDTGDVPSGDTDTGFEDVDLSRKKVALADKGVDLDALLSGTPKLVIDEVSRLLGLTDDETDDDQADAPQDDEERKVAEYAASDPAKRMYTMGKMSAKKFNEVFRREHRKSGMTAAEFLPPGALSTPTVTKHAEAKPKGVEERQVAAHYQKFSETFDRMSTSKEDLLSAFRSAAQRTPGLTAAKFIAGKRAVRS